MMPGLRFDDLILGSIKSPIRLKNTPTTSFNVVSLPQQLLRGHVTKIIDGDTIEVDGQPVRLLGIDAPELGFPGSWDPVMTLEQLAWDKDVLVDIRGFDPYGRALAVVWLPVQGGMYLNLASELLRKREAAPYFTSEMEKMELEPALNGLRVYGVKR